MRRLTSPQNERSLTAPLEAVPTRPRRRLPTIPKHPQQLCERTPIGVRPRHPSSGPIALQQRSRPPRGLRTVLA